MRLSITLNSENWYPRKMEPILVILAPLIVIFFAIFMSQVEQYVVRWKPKTVTQDGEINIESLNADLAQNAEQSAADEQNA